MAYAGGVIGVWIHLADSLKDFVESIKAMVEAVGIDHVGIGSDTDLLSSRLGQGTNKAWPGLTRGFFQAVVGEMLLQASRRMTLAKSAAETSAALWARLRLVTPNNERSCPAGEFNASEEEPN